MLKTNSALGLLLTTSCLLMALVTPVIAQPNLQDVTVTRLMDRPIIGPELHPSIGENIQGPTLVKVPDWVSEKLGKLLPLFRRPQR